MAGRRPGPERPPRSRVPWSRLLARLAGAVGLVLTSAALYWATTDATFAVDPSTVGIEGARLTGTAVVRGMLDLPADRMVNIFRIPTSRIEDRLAGLPAVRRATVRATLPDRLSVSIEERTPILVWHDDDGAWMVDIEGVRFAAAASFDPAALGSGATGSALPWIEDERPPTAPSQLGDRLAATDLEVVRLLGALTPEMVGSAKPELRLRVGPEDGWVLEAEGAWRAVFGFYSPTIQLPAVIPRQVQCLHAVLADREARVGQITLAPSSDACGTFSAREEP